MFVVEVMRRTVDLSQSLRVLDLCAAPGGKSTLMASLLNSESFLLPNEVIQNRFQILNQNVQKWGLPNILTSNHDSKDFEGLNGFFDVLLVDR